MARTKKKEESGILRSELLGTLNKLRPGLARKDVVDQATSFAFIDGFAWSFNDEVAVSHPLPDGMDIEGAVPADAFLKFLTKCKADRITMEKVDEELIVKCGRSKAGFTMEETKLPVDEIPLPEDDGWKDLPGDFLAAIKLCAPSASADDGTSVLASINITGKTVLACDNFRLTQVTLKKKLMNFRMPAAVVSDLIPFAPVSMALLEGWVHFINDEDVVFSCRVLDGKYPNVSAILDVEGDEVELPESLSEALDRAGVFAEAEFETDEEVTLVADGKTLQVTAKGSHGWIEEELTLKLDGDTAFKLTVNPAILKQALKLDSSVTICENAILIEGETFKHVVALA